SMQTAAIFMPVFFKELQRDGQIDRAMSVARGYVRSKPDWWVPVLFMRLKSGRIWYSPGFAGESQFNKWESLLERIDSGRCTPILGSGLLEWIFGSTREIAQQWAERYHFPMESYYREYLPQVSQFLAVSQDDEEYPYRELGKYLRGEIMRRFKDDLPDEARNFKLDQLIETTAMKRWERNPVEPHNILAQLPFSIYITTNPDNLLSKALMRAAKNPRSEICRWNERLSNLPTTEDSEPDYYPDFKNPLIFHLFGRLNEQDPQVELDSLVLTEDDYFDYLIGVTKYKKMIPTAVQSALTNTALLFLGFKMDDWNFRVFFRSIMSQGGGQLRRKYTHVAVQIDPEESRILEPERARSFLESYFGGAQISIYWGSVEDFMSELNRRRKGDDV
ncbi:SIR2 family protein, partial [bacterium]|nr:SIR2 family protein [bacterium]